MNIQTMPKAVQEFNAVITLVSREISIGIKSPVRIMQALMWPLMMFGMFGNQISQNIGGRMDFDYNQFMLLGMLVNGLFMMTTLGVTNLVEDRENDFTQEILVSPVSRYAIILGKIIGASVMSYVQFFATLIIGFFIGATIGVAEVLLLLSLSPLMCLAAGSLGVLCVGAIKKSSTANFVVMMVVMAQMFLSGALIPVNHSQGILAVFSRILPMTYCIDFTRGMFYQHGGLEASTTLYAPPVDLLIIAGFTLVFLITGTSLFVRSEKNR